MSFITPLVSLTLSSSTVVEGAAADTVIGTLQKMSVGGAARLVDSYGGRVKLVGSQIVVVNLEVLAEQRPFFEIVVEEFNPGCATPRNQTVLKITLQPAALPVVTAAPQTTAPASPKVGDEITATDAVGNALVVQGRWMRVGTSDIDGATEIVGASGRTYKLRAEDRGFRVAFQNLIRNLKGLVYATSSISPIIAGGDPIVIAPPSPPTTPSQPSTPSLAGAYFIAVRNGLSLAVNPFAVMKAI